MKKIDLNDKKNDDLFNMKSEKTYKRGPSEYNVFMKTRVAELRKLHPSKNTYTLMGIALDEWNNKQVELSTSGFGDAVTVVDFDVEVFNDPDY